MISISQVIAQTGVPASTLRYYEEIGLLHPAGRVSRRRQYNEDVFQRLDLIHTGQQAGFTLAELRILLNTILEEGDVKWHELVTRKMKEMDVLLQHITSMKHLLEDIMDCEDSSLAECIVQTGQKHALNQ